MWNRIFLIAVFLASGMLAAFVPRAWNRTVLAARFVLVTSLLILIVHDTVVYPMRVSSDSMAPAFARPDIALVETYAYDARLPIVNAALWRHDDPKRGEVIVFHIAADPMTYYIKRVVGIPGDRIDVVDDAVSLN